MSFYRSRKNLEYYYCLNGQPLERVNQVSLLQKYLHGKQYAKFFSGQYSSQSNNLYH